MISKDFKTKITIVALILASFPVGIFVLEYNPWSNAQAIAVVQKVLQAMEYRYERRTITDDITYLRNEIFYLESKRTDLKGEDNSEEIEKRIHDLSENILRKERDIKDLEAELKK